MLPPNTLDMIKPKLNYLFRFSPHLQELSDLCMNLSLDNNAPYHSAEENPYIAAMIVGDRRVSHRLKQRSFLLSLSRNVQVLKK